jgi:hypothetical protein
MRGESQSYESKGSLLEIAAILIPELWQDDEVYLREGVTPAEMMEIENRVPPDSWHVGTPVGGRPSA